MLVTLMAFAVVGVCGGAVATVIAALRHRPIKAPLLLLVVSLLLAGGTLLALAVRGAAAAGKWVVYQANTVHTQIAAQQAKSAAHDRDVAAHVTLLRSYVPAALRGSEPADFYTYGGFRDWWRIPLRFPYELESIDTLEFASLGKFNGQGPVSDPNVSCTGLQPGGITHFAFDANFLLMERSPQPPGAPNGRVIWSVFDFRTEQEQVFPDRNALLKAAVDAGYAGDAQFKSLQEWYDLSY